MENGEWEMGNRKWEMGNGIWERLTNLFTVRRVKRSVSRINK